MHLPGTVRTTLEALPSNVCVCVYSLSGIRNSDWSLFLYVAATYLYTCMSGCVSEYIVTSTYLHTCMSAYIVTATYLHTCMSAYIVTATYLHTCMSAYIVTATYLHTCMSAYIVTAIYLHTCMRAYIVIGLPTYRSVTAIALTTSMLPPEIDLFMFGDGLVRKRMLTLYCLISALFLPLHCRVIP